MSYYFGKAFKYSFYPLSTDELDYELLTNTIPAIYLFEDLPTEAEATAGTGAVQALGSWTDTQDALGKNINFAAVVEPADLQGYKRNYYIAINTELEVGQPLPPVIKEITLQRLRAQESIIDVSIEDVLEVEAILAEWLGDCNKLQSHIDTAIKEVKLAMTGCNIQYGDLVDPGVLNYAVVQLAISRVYFSLSVNPSDRFFADGVRFSESYKNQLKHAKLLFDSNRDGVVDGVRKGTSGLKSFRIIR